MPLLFGALIRLIGASRFAVMTAYLFGLIGYTAQFCGYTALHDVSGFAGFIAIPSPSCCRRFSRFIRPSVFMGVEKMQPSRWAKTSLLLPILWDAGGLPANVYLTSSAGAQSAIPKSSKTPVGRLPFGRHSYGFAGAAFLSAWLVLLIDNHGRLETPPVAP